MTMVSNSEDAIHRVPTNETPFSSSTQMGDTERRQPLAGVRVLELGSFVAAPLAARMLADFGAEVIKADRGHAHRVQARRGRAGTFGQQHVARSPIECLPDGRWTLAGNRRQWRNTFSPLPPIASIPDERMPEGVTFMAGIMPRLTETPGTIAYSGGDLGADNPAVYGDFLGLASRELERLQTEGII